MMEEVIRLSGAGPTATASSIPEMESRRMSQAECEQCALDDFWGLVANQAEQAEATAAMEMEDWRSEAVRAGIKKEEKFALWEKEDLRIRGNEERRERKPRGGCPDGVPRGVLLCLYCTKYRLMIRCVFAFDRFSRRQTDSKAAAVCTKAPGGIRCSLLL